MSAGIFADMAGTETSLSNINDFAPFNWYVVGFDLAGQVKAYEFSLNAPPTLTILALTLAGPGPGNIGTNTNVIAFTGACVDGSGAFVLASYNGGFFAPGSATGVADITMCMGPAVPSSLTPPAPGYAQCDNTLVPFESAYCGGSAYPDNCFVVNPSTDPPGSCNFLPGVSPSSLDFGTISAGDSVSQSFVIYQDDGATEPYEGTVEEPCEHYTITEGAGPFSLTGGDSLSVRVKFAPTAGGAHTCEIAVGEALSPVTCTGTAIAPQVTPESLDFGTISVDGFTFRSFTVTNPTDATLSYTGIIAESCPHYFIVQGGGFFSLAPGESHDVNVRFLPTLEGVHSCAVEIGNFVDPVQCTGEAVLPPECFVSVDSLRVPPTVLGHATEGNFFVTNLSGGDLIGDLDLNCSDFEITAGGGPFVLAVGDTLDVTVRFSPSSVGAQECWILGDGYFCTDVVITSAATTSPSFADLGLELGDGFTRSAAWADYDRDGDEDLYLTRRGVPNILFENQGGSFVENTPTLLSDTGNGFSSVWLDQNNDGRLGLIISNINETNIQILHGDPFGLVAVTGNSPLADVLDSRVIAPADYDRDGLLDLYVVQRTGESSLLLRGGGSGANYTRVISAADEQASGGRGANWTDIDDDGYPDLYLVNSTTPNSVYRNAAGTLVETQVPALELDGNNTDAAWGDYDNDGDLDVYVTTFESPNRLVRNDGNWQFTNVTVGALADPGRSGPPSWIDVDLDGDLDLHYVNGPGVDRLFINEDGAFYDASFGAIGDVANHAGAAWSDIDGDGDPDAALANWDAGISSKVIRNENDNGNHWVGFDLYGTSSNRFGVGARIRIVAGATSQWRWLGTGHSGKAPAGHRVMFGLGSSAVIDTVEIRWPSGAVDVGTDLAVDRVYDSTEGGSVTAVDDGAPARGALMTRLYQNHPNPFNPRTTVSFELATGSNARVEIYDVAGRHVRTLVDEHLEAGRHERRWEGTDDNGRSVASGIYLIRFHAGGLAQTIRAALVR